MRIRSMSAPPRYRELEDEIEKVRKEKEDSIENQEFEKAASLRDKERKLTQKKRELEEDWRSNNERSETQPEVGEDEIADIVSMWTGIPVFKLTEAETQKLIRMEDELHKRVIGQHEAIVAVSKSIRRARAGIKDPKRPTGSFIFLGPSGVGKTELARTLAEFLFGDEDALIQVDMSEYMEKHSVSRLVGSPPGYIGYDEGGQLTEAVRRKPYSVVLLDEIEKAHPDVFNVLLQILDDGRLTDGHGRTVDFRNTVLIMTSNIRSAEAMRDHFRPEFLNRIDEIVEFEALTREQLGEIVELQLERLKARLAERGLQIELTPAAKEVVAEAGWDPTYGARPLKRSLQRLVENPLALRLLEGDFSEGDTILVDARDGELVFEKAAAMVA
jgi:ATP-dependent Clp protease ATP-binding subunit ClpC